MADEEDAEHVPDLTLVPVGAAEEGNDRGDGGDLVGEGLEADAGGVVGGEEVVYDLGLEGVVTRGGEAATKRSGRDREKRQNESGE